jgi:hypothetical protein
MEAKTNDKGEWTMTGLTAGGWNFEFLKDGFDSQRMTVQVTENRNPPIDMKLTKAAPAVDPNVELQAAMKEAVELQKGGKNPEARKIIEDLIAKYPRPIASMRSSPQPMRPRRITTRRSST